MHDTVRFWLELGVDGFRLDALPLIGKDALLRANPDDAQQWGQYNIDWQTVHDRLRRLRALCESYGERILVGEVNILDLDRLAKYVTGGDELHLAHNFLFLEQPWQASHITKFIADVERALAPPALPSWYLGNHDNPRVVSRLGDGRLGTARARAAALLLLTVRGVPFIYQGEELGLPDSPIPHRYRHDIDAREPQRVPMPRDAPSRAKGGGFTCGDPWLPVHPLAESLNVTAEMDDEHSMLTLYRRLIELRSRSEALRCGEYHDLSTSDAVACFARRAAHQQVAILLNFTNDAQTVSVAVPTAARKGRLLLSTNAIRPAGMLDLASVALDANEGLVIEIPLT